MPSDLAYLFEDDKTSDLVGFDSLKRTELLSRVEELGMIEAAAAEIGLTIEAVRDAMAADSRLDADLRLAVGRYKASVLRRITDLAFNGSKRAIVGGKNRDIILGADDVPSDKAMELISKMQFSNELATVSRQRITADVTTTETKRGKKTDFSALSREDRKEVEVLFKRAQKILEKEGGEGSG